MPNTEKYTDKQEVGFDLGDLIAFLWQKKIRIIVTASAILFAGGFYIVNLPKYYTASSTLLLGSGESTLNLPSSVAGFANPGDSKMDTYMEFIRSRQFIESVVIELGLQFQPEFQPVKPYGTEQEQLEHSIRYFLNNLSLSRLVDTELLKISFESPTPKLSAGIVNHLGPAFFEFYAQMRKKKADDASQWINSQLSLLETKLGDAEKDLQDFLRENRLIDVKSQIELARTEISALLTENLLNEKQLAGIEATVAQVKQREKNYDDLLQIPWVLQNPLVVDLRGKIVSQEQVLVELSKRYKSKHHKYISAKSMLDNLQLELVGLLDNLKASLEQEYNTLKVRRTALKNQIEVIKSQHSDLGKHELQLSRLTREVESTQKLYEVFVARLQETEFLKDLGNTEEFIVVDVAAVPRVPSRPKVLILLAVTAILSGFVSAGGWLALHLVSDRQTRFRQLLNNLDVPVLSQIPKLKKGLIGQSVADVVEKGQKNYLFAEAIRTIRTVAMLPARDSLKENRVIAVMGIKEGDGKSTISISLAQSFSKLEKTLLVDTDLRSPSIAKAFDIERDHPGISNFVGKGIKFSDCSVKLPDSQLTVMPSGEVPTDPLAYISKPRFANVVNKLGIFYERVVIEAPPMNAYSDALILSKLVDCVILVCDVEQTESAELLESIQRLRESGAPLLGVVFNRVKGLRSQVRSPSKVRRFVRKFIGF